MRTSSLRSYTVSCFARVRASLPSHPRSRQYIEARTADVYTGPCFANASRAHWRLGRPRAGRSTGSFQAGFIPRRIS